MRRLLATSLCSLALLMASASAYAPTFPPLGDDVTTSLGSFRDKFPPRVVYLHDASSIVQVVFVSDKPPLWFAGDVLGYFLLAGHGVGFSNSSTDMQEFTDYMNQQSDIQCPLATQCTQPTAKVTQPAGASGVIPASTLQSQTPALSPR